MFRAHVLKVRRTKIVLYSLWYHHTYRWPSGAQIERGLDYEWVSVFLPFLMSVFLPFLVSVCILALFIRHANRMFSTPCCIDLWPVWLSNIFPNYLIKHTIFRKRVIEHRMWVLIFLYKFVWKKNSFRENFNEILSQIYTRLHLKYPLFLSDFN